MKNENIKFGNDNKTPNPSRVMIPQITAAITVRYLFINNQSLTLLTIHTTTAHRKNTLYKELYLK